MSEKEPEKRREVGHYVVLERTARRLAAERRSRPLIAVGVMWGVFLPIGALVAPWLGGTRLLITAAAAAILIVVSLLVVIFTPTQQQIVIDLEGGELHNDLKYLFPRRQRVQHVPLSALKEVRRRRRVWRDPGEVKRVEWVVDLVGHEGQVWSLVEGEGEESSAELARLVAEVSGCPLEGRV
jgi:hypothetical protein